MSALRRSHLRPLGLLLVGSTALAAPMTGAAAEPPWIEQATDCADLRTKFLTYYASLSSLNEGDLSDARRAELRSVLAAVCGERFRSCGIDVCPVDSVQEPRSTAEDGEHRPTAAELSEEAFQRRYEATMQLRREKIEELMREEREKGKTWQPINPN